MAQKQTSKINFQDGGCGGHFGFPINKILATFISTGWLVTPSYFDLIRRVVWEKMLKIDFLIGTILAIFNLEVILLLQCVTTQIAKWFGRRSQNLVF